MRRRIEDKNTRKLFMRGASYSVTLPKDMIRELKWKDGQKVVVKKRGKSLIITDWQ